jgi:hypothetical protein
MTAILRSLVIWAGLLFWPALYVLTSLTVVLQTALVLAALLGMVMYAVSESKVPQWRDE